MKHLIFLLISLSLFSCTKHREIKIIGRNAVTGQGYEGLQYKVVSSKTGNDGEVYRTEATGNLDANGEAFVSIKQRKGRSYSLRVFGPSNNCYTNEVIQSFDSPYDVNGTFTFEFAECAYLKLNINNVNCSGASDYFKLYHYGSTIDYHDYSNGNPIKEGGGCYSYLGSYFSDVPIGSRYYKWEVTRNNITNTYYDTIYLSPGEYKTYDINY
jgi:hypothetical protein